MSIDSKLQQITDRHAELTALMSSGELEGDKFVEVSKEYAELEPVVAAINDYTSTRDEIADLKTMLDDPEMAEIAKEELKELEPKLPDLEQKVKKSRLSRPNA